MVGERDVVEIRVGVVGVEGRPCAILALQSLDPFARPGDGRQNGRPDALVTPPRSARSIAIATTAVSSVSG